ncbi:hypothetical protein [Hydrogenophaga sp. RWCD_12]|uniref:hypothetical protein n=1 Tax=Hydrogenophaga sp. RWCD_12 TaxID=3391190 RepID=UPI0039856999
MSSAAQKCHVVQTSFPPDDDTDMESLRFTPDGLSFTMVSSRWRAKVVFAQTYGFRVLDELDMAEHLSGCCLADGWLFEVACGGWKDFECTRPSFTTGRLSWVREYLVIGRDKCASVLTKEEPVVQAEVLSGSFFESDALSELNNRISEVLFYQWDPIGVSDMLNARDEYDIYVPLVVGKLTGGATQQEVAALLDQIASERMGLLADPARTGRTAALACEWFERVCS